jgi:hypothetical protein
MEDFMAHESSASAFPGAAQASGGVLRQADLLAAARILEDELRWFERRPPAAS